MKKQKIIPAALIFSAIILCVVLWQKNIYGQENANTNSTLTDEFKSMMPEIQNGKKTLAVFQGERAIQSQIRDIRFGSDYFIVQDSVWNGKGVSIRKMYIKSSEILWLVEDENSIILRLKN